VTPSWTLLPTAFAGGGGLSVVGEL
jgi:hypothetical protein